MPAVGLSWGDGWSKEQPAGWVLVIISGVFNLDRPHDRTVQSLDAMLRA